MLEPVSSIDLVWVIIFIWASKERLKSISLIIVSMGLTLLPSKVPLCNEATPGPVGKSVSRNSGANGAPEQRHLTGVAHHQTTDDNGGRL